MERKPFMTSGLFLLSLVLTLWRVKVVKSANITVGYLTADRDWSHNPSAFVKNKQGRIISGAMTYAINQINEDPNLLPGHTLQFMWADTHASTLHGTAALTDQWKDGAMAFFGPEDSCEVEARVAAAWNLPMISYKCANHKVSDKELYPTFARTFPPATQVTKSIISLLRHFKWQKFTMVIGSSGKWHSIAEKLEEQSVTHNLTINGKFEFEEPHLPESNGNPFPKIVTNSFKDTRVYVFLGEHNGMVDMMSDLETKGLLATGEYVVIYTDLETFDNVKDPLKYFKRTYDAPIAQRNANASQSLLVVVSSPPRNPDYAMFHRFVNNYNEKPPFSFPNPFKMQKVITVYAAYLYDAVKLYATALHDVLMEGGSPRDGKAIINKIKGRSYQSIQGTLSYIDENGDAEGNYTVLARHPFDSPYGKYSMVPVGHFEIGDTTTDIPNFVMLPDQFIDWIRGDPPLDEPSCGYRGQYCIPPPNYTLEIVCGVLGSTFFVVIVIGLIVYRNWRYEQEIAGLLWKIDRQDIQPLHQGNHGGSRTSLVTVNSLDSTMFLTQIFTKTASYKGTVVALKKYTKKGLDISRSMKKEMKLMKDLRHDNVVAFIGACVDQVDFFILTEYCSKGSLQDILENEDVKLDSMFIASLVMDLIKGMIFLHASDLHYHGNLKSSNCVVNSRWTLQVTDFGLLQQRLSADPDSESEGEFPKYKNKFWTAPELLRNPSSSIKGSQKGDVYSFGIILYEIIGRDAPYAMESREMKMTPKEIIEKVKDPLIHPPFRPDLSEISCQDYVLNCIQDCWHENTETRPDFKMVKTKLNPMREGMKKNIFDNMIDMMEKYQTHLEELVSERTEQLVEEKKKTEALLHRMLPKTIADQLVTGQPVIPEAFKLVTIYFSDICGFTALSAESTPLEVVDMLNDLYTLFDNIIRNYDVYKVETIGDAYMVVSGLPVRNGDNHAGEIASMSLHLLKAIKNFKIKHKPETTLKLRIGIHSGPCVAGVVGLTMPRYCLFGDTVNTASRMESNGEALRIHLSESCYSVLKKLGGYELEERGLVAMKGKGEMLTYWLNNENEKVRFKRLSIGSSKINYIHSSPEIKHKPKDKMNASWSNVVDSPKVRDGKDISERNFYELMRDGVDSSSMRGVRPNIGRTSSFRTRRRSFDGRSPSKDCLSSNGFVHKRNSDLILQNETEKTTAVPSIVVDKHDENEVYVPKETDCLLDSKTGNKLPPSLENKTQTQKEAKVYPEKVPLKISFSHDGHTQCRTKSEDHCV